MLTCMEATRECMLAVGVQQGSDQIAGEVVLCVNTVDGSAIGKNLSYILSHYRECYPYYILYSFTRLC